ncbi:hypothetical protein [Moraxella oculi]|uniref:Uncharacterized protein n=1 Tax=Moraxella oculi TaxID=2940516 RepID=A0ABW8U639_9GAMM
MSGFLYKNGFIGGICEFIIRAAWFSCLSCLHASRTPLFMQLVIQLDKPVACLLHLSVVSERK